MQRAHDHNARRTPLRLPNGARRRTAGWPAHRLGFFRSFVEREQAKVAAFPELKLGRPGVPAWHTCRGDADSLSARSASRPQAALAAVRATGEDSLRQQLSKTLYRLWLHRRERIRAAQRTSCVLVRHLSAEQREHSSRVMLAALVHLRGHPVRLRRRVQVEADRVESEQALRAATYGLRR